MRAHGAHALAAALALALATACAASRPYVEPQPQEGGKVVTVKLDFNIAKAAPDCFCE